MGWTVQSRLWRASHDQYHHVLSVIVAIVAITLPTGHCFWFAEFAFGSLHSDAGTIEAFPSHSWWHLCVGRFEKIKFDRRLGLLTKRAQGVVVVRNELKKVDEEI
jgi:hypothetical protein